jgi:ADP-L-glycero-D-manno-heptose 6-epimerase
MIVITGAAGFIASRLARRLNADRFVDLVLVDDFSREAKRRNYSGLTCVERIDRDAFFPWLTANEDQVQFIFHLGARTDTTLQDKAVFDRLNVQFSQEVWKACVEYGLPLVYASSAATYGDGSHGWSDDHAGIGALRPLNPYGDSKQAFDVWALAEDAAGRAPYFWAGMKFFNVYGPHEDHKGRMASVAFHAFHQFRSTGRMRLFRSHRADFEDGGQMRDFVFVDDLVDVLVHFMHHRNPVHRGIYNLGSGQARSFLDLATATAGALGLPAHIDFIDTPEDIRDTYQYFTEADLSKLRSAGYHRPFTPLEDAVRSYVQDYLLATVAS